MKKSTVAFMLLVALSVTFGCKKDDKDDTSPATPGVSVKYDGNTWTAVTYSGVYYSSLNLTVIYAGNGTTQVLSFGFTGSSTGTYNLYGKDQYNFGRIVIGSGEEDTYETGQCNDHGIIGKVVVTEYDKTNHTLSGTFNFEGYNYYDGQKTFSEGTFTKVAYIAD